jgi:hypothetical protein
LPPGSSGFEFQRDHHSSTALHVQAGEKQRPEKPTPGELFFWRFNVVEL